MASDKAEGSYIISHIARLSSFFIQLGRIEASVESIVEAVWRENGNLDIE